MRVKSPKPDPLLQAEEQQQLNTNLTTIQKESSANTDTLARLYGATAAISGGTLKAPILGN